MKIQFLRVTFNGMGGHPMLSFVGDFLLEAAPPISGAFFDAIDVYANFQHSGPRSPNLELLSSRLRRLPPTWLN
jgi:hypothetical protein